MTASETTRRALASYLLAHDRMVVEPTPEMLAQFPLDANGDVVAWLKAAAKLLGSAAELRMPFLPSGQPKLAIKDRAVLFNYTQDVTLEDMAEKRKTETNA